MSASDTYNERPLQGGWTIARDLARLVCDIRRELFDGYHPERHYMRGPGPKWRERQAAERPSTNEPLHI
jgi:hypothetical protein